MAAAPARALAAHRRWGFSGASAGAASTRTPAAVVLGTAPDPTNLPTQRGAVPSGVTQNTPTPSAWGSSSPLSLKNGGVSDLVGNINDRPSSGGSSSTLTDGSDLLDSPLGSGRTSHNSSCAAIRPQTTELGSGRWKVPNSQTSFSAVLKGPLRTIDKKRPTSHGKGFALSTDDFPVLVSKNSQSEHKKGHSFQGRPTFSSIVIAAPNEKRKTLTTGGGPTTANFPKKAQTPDICMPPPCVDYWHPPPDHPPDRDGNFHGEAASYSLCKPADTPRSFPVQSLAHNGHSLFSQGEPRQGPVHGGSQPENNGSCSAHVPADIFVKSLPHLILGKGELNHSNALEKQPVIKKDMSLLEKIKCLNIKARNLRACSISEIFVPRESKVEDPKCIDVKADHLENDVPFNTVSSDTSSAIDMINSVSESSNHVPIDLLNVSANLAMTDLPDGHDTESSEARKPAKSADNDVPRVESTSRNRCDSCATDTASDIWGHGWEEHSPADFLSVTMTSTHEDQPFPGNCSQQNSRTELSAQNAKQIQEQKRGKTQQKAKPIVKVEDSNRRPFVNFRIIDDMLNSHGYDYEIQLSRELFANNAKQLHKEEREIQQGAKANAKLEELNRSSSVQNQESNDVRLEDQIPRNAGCSGTTSHDTSTSDTCRTVYDEYLNVPLRANGIKNTAVPISSTPMTETTGVSRDHLTHNVIFGRIALKTASHQHDSSAPKHLQVEVSEGQVPEHESISRWSTPASDTAHAEHIDQKDASQSDDNSAPMHLQTEDIGRQVRSQGRVLRGYTPASRSASVNKGSLIHDVMPSAKNTMINTKAHIARKSVSQSHENIAPKHLQMENRQRQAHSQERVLQERINVAESTEKVTTVAVSHLNAQNAGTKSQADLRTQSKKYIPAAPCVFGTENIVTEVSGMHKTHTSGVVINSSIIPMQAASVRGFTVGSIMLGDSSPASVHQDGKTVAKEVHDYTTNSGASPKQTKQSGKNQHVQSETCKNTHVSDSFISTQVKEPVKKEQSGAGGLNCIVIPAPTKPSGNHSIGSQNVAPGNTIEMESHAHKHAYKERHLQNPRKMLPADKHATPCDNPSTSKVKTKSRDKEAVDTSSTAEAEADAEPENQEKKPSTHLGKSSASLNQTTTNGSSDSEGPERSEQEANSLLLKIMQELSDQLEQVEMQLESSTRGASANRSQPTQVVSLPGYTWGERRMSQNQRQYHVRGQGTMLINYAANSHMDVSGMAYGAAALPTSTVLPLPGPFSVPPSNTLHGSSSSTPGWIWDAAEGQLISDLGSFPDIGTTTIERGGGLMENAYRDSQMDLHSTQAFGGMAYRAAAMIPEIGYHTGLQLQQLSPAWSPHDEHNDRNHGGSSGTGVYLLGMDSDAGRQTHAGVNCTATGPMVGAGRHDYQLMPIASPVSAVHPAAATWGVPYWEHVYLRLIT